MEAKRPIGRQFLFNAYRSYPLLMTPILRLAAGFSGLAPDLSASRKKAFDRLVLAGTVLGYAVLAARRLDVPVPGFDEIIYVPPALELLRHAREWPLMVNEYVGCPMTYLIAPFIGFWGLSVATMRLPAIGVALAAVLIFLYLVSKIFPRLPLWAPAAACLLNSRFLITSRTGLYVDASIHWLLLSLTLLCLWNWSQTRRPLHAFLAFVCVGFGIYSKIIFVWFAFPAALAVASLSRRDGRAARASLAGLCALGLLIGALPLVIHNVANEYETVHIIGSSVFFSEDPSTASNLSFLQNLETRSEHLLSFFTGDFEFTVGPVAGAYQFTSGPARTLAGAVLLILFAAAFFLFREKTQFTALAIAGSFIAALFVGSTITPSQRHPEHLYPILPLILLLSGVALAKLIPGRLPLLLATALLALPQLRHFSAAMRDAAQSTDQRSPRALSSLSEFLSTAGITRPMTMDWGLSNPLLVASGGEVAPRNDLQDPPRFLKAGGMAVCLWKPAVLRPNRQGCDRLLRNRAFILGEIRKFPAAPERPVYAAIPVLGVR